MSIHDTPDDPNRVGDEDYRPGDAAQQRLERDEAEADERGDDEWYDRRYRGNLMEDCAAAAPDSILDMVGRMEELSASIQGREPRTLEGDFRRVFGGGK
jgi:hypothetical protein